jgi:hypothetical protein
MSAVFKKAKFLQVFLKDSSEVLRFVNCNYSYDENSSALIVADPKQGGVTLPKAMLGEVYVGETSSSALRLINS